MNKRFAVAAIVFALLFSSAAYAQETHTHPGANGVSHPELETPSTIPLDPAGGSAIGAVFQAYLSPHQEGGDEEQTPIFIPPQFRSTAPSVPRAERTSRGHAVIEFTRDLSRAYVHLAVENVDPTTIVMLHLHCGRPGQLGPIIVDFSLVGDIQAYLSDGRMSVEIGNSDIEAVTAQINNPIDGFTLGCPIVPSLPTDKVKTIAGMETIAREGELYFNLHTAGQVYFGDIRGQFRLVSES